MICRNRLRTSDAFGGGDEVEVNLMVEVSLMGIELHGSQALRGLLCVESQLVWEVAQWEGQPGLATSFTSKL